MAILIGICVSIVAILLLFVYYVGVAQLVCNSAKAERLPEPNSVSDSEHAMLEGHRRFNRLHISVVPFGLARFGKLAS